MPRTPVVLSLVTLLVTSSPLSAQHPTPGDWSIVDAQPAGVALVVEIVGGEEVPGTLARAGAIDLELTLASGQPRLVPKSAIVEVRTYRRVGDPLKNGMTYGSLIGAAAMGALVGFLFTLCGGACDAPSVPGVLVPSLALGAGVGIGAGAGIDAAIRRPMVLYRRVGA